VGLLGAVAALLSRVVERWLSSKAQNSVSGSTALVIGPAG
jgi:hypothetical protein